MILCGGFGKRLRPVTETVPKPLVEISEDYTILDKQLFDFKNAGVNEVYLLAGFLHEKIEERYGDEYKGVKIGSWMFNQKKKKDSLDDGRIKALESLGVVLYGK